jgi:hypothetical protein
LLKENPVPLLVKGVKVELEDTENEMLLKDSEKLVVFPPTDMSGSWLILDVTAR